MNRIKYIEASGIENKIDFDAHYQVKGYKGIAFYLMGWLAENKPLMCYALNDEGDEVEIESGDFELEADYNFVVAVMVGDDRKHKVSIDDLEILPEDKFCRSCGQVGCGCNVYA